MPNYLVVAHQTATSEELLEKLQEIAREDPSAQFTLRVPTTRVNHLLTYTEGESGALAQDAADAARRRMEQAGLRVSDAIAADESPLQAIEDAIGSGTTFAAIVISTLPPGISRWLKMDVHTRARQRFELPVISVVASKQASTV